MSLFGTLLRLQVNSSNTPTEDYLTELFAFCLQIELELLEQFLKTFNIPFKNKEEYALNTQVRFKALPTHDQDSIPDMALFFQEHTIFIENKINALEGDKQLQRYAEHLDIMSGSKTLIYITRDYDPKKEKKIFKNCKNEISFIPLRWYQIARFFKSFKDHPIINELLIFMKANHLSSNNQFNPIDILTLNNFSRVRKMLNNVLHGKVSTRFKSITGGISQDSSSMTQLRDHDRYVIYKHKNNNLWIALGFWLNAFREEEYPTLSFVIEIAPSAQKREEIIAIFEKITSIENSKWEADSLNNPKAWSCIFIDKSMKDYLSKEDHIKEMEEFFLECMDEYEAVIPLLKEYL